MKPVLLFLFGNVIVLPLVAILSYKLGSFHNSIQCHGVWAAHDLQMVATLAAKEPTPEKLARETLAFTRLRIDAAKNLKSQSTLGKLDAILHPSTDAAFAALEKRFNAAYQQVDETWKPTK